MVLAERRAWTQSSLCDRERDGGIFVRVKPVEPEREQTVVIVVLDPRDKRGLDRTVAEGVAAPATLTAVPEHSLAVDDQFA
jgi:hypothetical protein